MDPAPIAPCGAQNRAGRPCARLPSRGKRRCYLHGGAPGSGARPGNANALKHGFYSSRVRELAADISTAAEEPLQLHGEIALLRAVLARAAATAKPAVVVSIVNALAHLIRAQRQLDLLDARMPPVHGVVPGKKRVTPIRAWRQPDAALAPPPEIGPRPFPGGQRARVMGAGSDGRRRLPSRGHPYGPRSVKGP